MSDEPGAPGDDATGTPPRYGGVGAGGAGAAPSETGSSGGAGKRGSSARVADAGHPVPGRGPVETDPPSEPLSLWEAYGVEIEYMIVDRESLDVRPVADRLVEAVTGMPGASEVERDPVAWSNELALHVLELKTASPAPGLEGLAGAFHRDVAMADRWLGDLGCRLLPGGMHPWMDPHGELRLWPHEYTEVYRTFDRIFSCRGHGWANLQSTHLNLPFRGDDEFRLLHEAVRLTLPLLPALAASSPVLDGRPGPALDNRLLAYRDNARAVPSVTGDVVPERVGGRREYREAILERIYRDLAPLDPEGVLRDEWVNARGAIARFGRGSVEVRVLDAQECPRSDLAVVAAVVEAVRRVAKRLDNGTGAAPDVPQDLLVETLEAVIHRGGDVPITHAGWLDALGVPAGGAGLRVWEVWRRILDEAGVLEGPSEWAEPLRVILEEGPLASRLRVALGLEVRPVPGEEAPGRERLRAVWKRLADCLRDDRVFRPDG